MYEGVCEGVHACMHDEGCSVRVCMHACMMRGVCMRVGMYV